MPLSKNEHRQLHDTIYTDLQDLKDKISALLESNQPQKIIINTLNDACMNIPKKAVRIIGKNVQP